MTTTADITIKKVLDNALPGELSDALRMVKLGTMLSPFKRAFTGLTAAAAFDLTAIDGTGETLGVSNEKRKAAVAIGALRVTASGTANSVGSYAISDAAGTPVSPTAGANVGLATLSDDGKTVTFPTTVTAFIVEYIPRMADLSAKFASL